jgi:hypothetical protein
MYVKPFVRCKCGKLHVISLVSAGTVCPTCKRSLYSLFVFGKQED